MIRKEVAVIVRQNHSVRAAIFHEFALTVARHLATSEGFTAANTVLPQTGDTGDSFGMQD